MEVRFIKNGGTIEASR